MPKVQFMYVQLVSIYKQTNLTTITRKHIIYIFLSNNYNSKAIEKKNSKNSFHKFNYRIPKPSTQISQNKPNQA